MNTTLDPATIDAAIACLDDANDPTSPDFWPAINTLCDIERTIPAEARAAFYGALSAHLGDDF